MQPHVDRVVVLRNGIEQLRQSDACPEQLRQAAQISRSVRDVLAELENANASASFRARLWHYSQRGSEKEIKVSKSKVKENQGTTKSGIQPDKKSLVALTQQLRTLGTAGKVSPHAALYISELRWQQKVKHPLDPDEEVKTATNCDIFDVAPFSRHMPLWERSEGGIFIGERGAGSGLHVDQCLWSNVGRNWCGFKLFAIWPWEERHKILDDKDY